MAKKKITKKPSKKGLKQKQKQSQSVVVNINTTKSRAKRSPSQPVYRQQPQYITMQSEPSPPIIYNTVGTVKETVFEPVRVPTNSIGIQTFTPQTVRASKIPVASKKTNDEAVVNLTDLYKTPDDNFYYDNVTPIARRTRAVLALSEEEIERRRLDRNDKARLKRLERRMGG